MNFRGFFVLTFGALAILMAIDGISTGAISGIGKSGTSKIVTETESPLHFWSSVILLASLGIYIVLKAYREWNRLRRNHDKSN